MKDVIFLLTLQIDGLQLQCLPKLAHSACAKVAGLFREDLKSALFWSQLVNQ